MPVVADDGSIIFDPVNGPGDTVVSASNPQQVSSPDLGPNGPFQQAPAPDPVAAPAQDPAQAAADLAAQNAAAAQKVQQQDAFARIQAVLDQYGISGLGDWLWGEIRSNNPESQIMLDLQNQPTFLTRFPGLKAMRDAGLPAVTPAQYLATENEYKRQLATLGFDTKGLAPQDFVPLFKGNLDPTEVKGRLDTFNTISTTFSPHMRQDFLERANINLSDTDLYNMFHGLDPTLALKYASATGTNPPSTADFQKSLAGVPGRDGSAPVTLTGLQQASQKAVEDEKALFHSFSAAGTVDKAIDTAPPGVKNF